MEKEGVWSHGISSSLMRLFSLRGMREQRGLAGMCPWAVLAVTSLSKSEVYIDPDVLLLSCPVPSSLTHLPGEGRGMGRDARCCDTAVGCWRFCCLWSGLAGSQESILCSVCPCNSL